MIRAYLRYLSRARDEHALHSPFLFALYDQIIRVDNRREPVLQPIRQRRKTLRRSRRELTLTDFGAGSCVNTAHRRTVGDIARHSQKPARFGRLLFRLVRRFRAETIVDLGTSLGLTTAYMAEAARPHGGRVLTFEGCPETAAVAQETFRELNLPNVNLIVGNLDETLAPAVQDLTRIDLAFFDANHRYEPTIRYFEACLTRYHNDTVFVFDDIHWSPDMEQAWDTIKAHPAVTVTVDLFWVGLVFFRREQHRQDFILRF